MSAEPSPLHSSRLHGEPVGHAYLDHAATTAMRPEVLAEMTAQLGQLGNASALHATGRQVRRTVEEARERLAAAVDARPSEVVFTSGGTESDNLAVVGTYRTRKERDARRTTLAISTIEHHAVLDSAEHLHAHEGALVHWLEADADARIQPERLAELLRAQPHSVAVVSVMWANNEVGTVQPIAELAGLARQAGVPFHTDAVQAVGQVPVSFADSGADLLTLTGHKLGGPVGAGALLVRRDAPIQSLTYGGGQERQLRSGTLNAPGIAGLALAVERAVQEREEAAQRLARLRDRLITGALGLGLGIEVSGAYTPGDVAGRLAGNAHLRIPDCEGDSLLYLLDAAGVACSTGSACTAGVPRPSHVLLAMGVPEEQARGGLRLSFGHTSTESDVDRFLEALPAAVERAQGAHAAGRRSSA